MSEKRAVVSKGRRFREVIVSTLNKAGKVIERFTMHEESPDDGNHWVKRHSHKTYGKISDTFYSANKPQIKRNQKKPVLTREATGTHTRVDGVHPMFWRHHEHGPDKHYAKAHQKMNELVSMISFSEDASPEIAKAIIENIGHGSTTVRAV